MACISTIGSPVRALAAVIAALAGGRAALVRLFAIAGAGFRSGTLALWVVLLIGFGSIAPLQAATFCTVTINSSHEAEALRAAFPASHFVELTEFGTSASSADWLPRACLAGVQCDVLLVSGHFANKFFGDSSFELPLKALERLACERTCDGILTRPRLVFLFGCNTLAGKQVDHRTPARYRDVLIEDGLDPDLADRVVALRYGPLGRETRARMRKVFGDKALLLGFSSVGPVGSVAGPAFSRYLRDARDSLAAVLAASGTGERPRQAAARSWTRAFSGLNPDAVLGGPPPSPDECAFSDGREARSERLRRAERLFSADPLRHALRLWDFLRAHADWQPEEVLILQRIKDNVAARRSLLAALPHLTGALDTYFDVLQLARVLDWVDGDELRRLEVARLDSLLRDGVTSAELDFLCARPLTYVPSDELLRVNSGRVRLVEALPCLAARSASVRTFLLGQLGQAPSDVRVAALESLTELSLLEPADVPRLRALFQRSGGEARAAVLWALAASDGASRDVQRFIAAAAGDADVDVAWTATQVVMRLRVDDVVAQLALARALSRPEGFVRRAAALALASLAPRDARLLPLLRSHADDPDDLVRISVQSLLVGRGDGQVASAETGVQSPGGPDDDER